MSRTAQSLELTGAVERALRAVQCVAEKGEFTPRDLAEDAGIPTSTAYRLLHSLNDVNFVEKASHGNYRVGRQLLRLASLVVSRFDYRAMARPFLADLASAFHETCAFALYLPGACAFAVVDLINAIYPLQYVIEHYAARPMIPGALGRAMLPYLPEQDVRTAAERQNVTPESGSAPLTWDMLMAEFEAIRRQGCFVAAIPNPLGTNGTAAPVFNARGQLLGSIGVTVPVVRYDVTRQPEVSGAVIRAARGMSAALGFDDWDRRVTQAGA